MTCMQQMVKMKGKSKQLLRRQTLFPTELRAHPFLTSLFYCDFHPVFDLGLECISWNTWNN